MKKILFAFLFLALLVPTTAFARIGVGVGIGKIVVNQQLKPGIIYNLPPFTVINTGSVPTDYEVAVTFNERQQQKFPKESWFIFSPQHFHLAPGKVQRVDIKLNLPLMMDPGDYFAYLEAHPLAHDTNGSTTINIAAATKLYFTVVPANIFQAMYYKTSSFWEIYQPWTTIVAGIAGVMLVVVLFKRFFHLEINVKAKSSSKETQTHNE